MNLAYGLCIVYLVLVEVNSSAGVQVVMMLFRDMSRDREKWN
jgi:hypothetical protein